MSYTQISIYGNLGGNIQRSWTCENIPVPSMFFGFVLVSEWFWDTPYSDFQHPYFIFASFIIVAFASSVRLRMMSFKLLFSFLKWSISVLWFSITFGSIFWGFGFLKLVDETHLATSGDACLILFLWLNCLWTFLSSLSSVWYNLSFCAFCAIWLSPLREEFELDLRLDWS